MKCVLVFATSLWVTGKRNQVLKSRSNLLEDAVISCGVVQDAGQTVAP